LYCCEAVLKAGCRIGDREQIVRARAGVPVYALEALVEAPRQFGTVWKSGRDAYPCPGADGKATIASLVREHDNSRVNGSVQRLPFVHVGVNPKPVATRDLHACD
jgi:hypothetical protein